MLGNDFIRANMREFGTKYHQLRWLTPAQAERAEEKRAELLDHLADKAVCGFNGSKLDCRGLSPGCECCGTGTWSCLFITGRCNAHCAYCPSPQNESGVPATNTVPFPIAGEYADYIERFDFRGASISGGEPLLVLGAALRYIKEVKRRRGPRTHLWLYTNGTLANKQNLTALADAGLDEIRFDIGATAYHLKKLKLAAGIIPRITVEIPAMPQDYRILQAMLPELVAAGAQHLNLHQLRLTPHNFSRLVGQNYTFLHGERVTVLQSELVALQLLTDALDMGLNLPVNYCSAVFKVRFQQAAARRRGASVAAKSWEDITETGHLRSLSVVEQQLAPRAAAARLEAARVAPTEWQLSADGQQLFFSHRAWPALAPFSSGLSLRYDEALVCSSPEQVAAAMAVPLAGGRVLYVERRPALPARSIPPESIEMLDQLLNRKPAVGLSGDPAWQPILDHELLPWGLTPYF